MNKQIIKTKDINSKGITLVALIITIIVLLILAIVSISLIVNNGIITKADKAVFQTEIEQYEEQLKLSIAEDTMSHLESRGKFNATEYNDIKKIIPGFSRKYENKLVVEEDKLVYKGHDKELYRKALEIGLISEDE